VNRKYGHGNFKYVVISDPLLTGHVTRGMRSELFAISINLTWLWGFNHLARKGQGRDPWML